MSYAVPREEAFKSLKRFRRTGPRLCAFVSRRVLRFFFQVSDLSFFRILSSCSAAREAYPLFSRLPDSGSFRLGFFFGFSCPVSSLCFHVFFFSVGLASSFVVESICQLQPALFSSHAAPLVDRLSSTPFTVLPIFFSSTFASCLSFYLFTCEGSLPFHAGQRVRLRSKMPLTRALFSHVNVPAGFPHSDWIGVVFRRTSGAHLFVPWWPRHADLLRTCRHLLSF